MSELRTCIGGTAAIEFMEGVLDLVPEEHKTFEFCTMFERSMNRFRYEVEEGIGMRPRRTKAKYSRYKEFYNCSKCGSCISVEHNYCSNCGTAAKWVNPRCLT